MSYSPPAPSAITFAFAGAYSPPAPAALYFDFAEVTLMADAPRLRHDTVAVVMDALLDKSDAVVHPARYWSTTGFLSGASDDPPHQYFDRLAGSFELAREVSCPFWERQQQVDAFGAVRLLNQDGGLDGLAEEEVRDRRVRAYIGRRGQYFADFVQVAEGVADAVDLPDEQTAQLTVLSRGAALQRALQTTLFGGVGNTALVDRVQPVAIGKPLSCPVPMVTPSTLYHACHDAVPHAVPIVRDRGVSVGRTLTSNGFTLTANPDGMIVADVHGAKTAGGALIERLPDVLEYVLVTRGGLDMGDIDWDSVDALDAAAPYPLALWIDQPTTIADVLTMILESYAGWWWFDRLGKLRVGRLEAPAGSPDLVIPAWQLDQRSIRRIFDRAPGLSSACLGQRNWYVYDQGNLAGSLLSPTVLQIGLDLQQQYRVRMVGAGTLAPEYTHGDQAAGAAEVSASRGPAGSQGMPTLFSVAADVQAEATRRVELYGQRRWHWEIPVRMSVDDALQLEPGQLVQVHANRYGMSEGVLLRVIGVRLRPRDSAVLIKAWG